MRVFDYGFVNGSGNGGFWLWSCNRSFNGVFDYGVVNRSYNGGF